jgi:hypothetical protein
MTHLERNIDALELAADYVRDEFDFATIKRFYHMVLLECAERMQAKDFAASITEARAQLRRPS